MHGRRTRELWAVSIRVGLSCALGVSLVLIPAACRDRAAAYRAVSSSAKVPGYFSLRGLPPVKGFLLVSASGLEFRSASDSTLVSYRTFRRIGPASLSDQNAAAAFLAYTGRIGARTSYVFRIRDGVFETAEPGPLLHLLDDLVLFENQTYGELSVLQGRTGDTAAMWDAVRRLVTSPYADTLYALFGRPQRATGLVGARGVREGNLAEYVRSRDSVALDPGRIGNEVQLRHALAHELGHRWEQLAPWQVDSILSRVSAINDRERYGHQSASEQRAEATAFAVHFLQSTAGPAILLDDATEWVRHYEFLVPGTHSMVRYLIGRPTYLHHPLRKLIIGDSW
jgi:hypothetical protein